MNTGNHKAFTMIELTFVIVIIGILAAIALPRFGESADNAYLTKAQSELATVRAALSTERQRRILRGDTATPITDLSLSSAGAATVNAFDHFSADGQNPVVYTEILRYPVVACANNAQRACWVTSAGVGAADKMYSYRFLVAADGQADFRLENNRLDCTVADAADCLLISR